MPALLAVIDAVLFELGDEELSSAIHARAADLLQGGGATAGSVARAKALVESASEQLRLSLEDGYRLMGERVVPLLAGEMAAHLRLHSTAHTFCLHLNTIVQSELQALVPTVPLPFIDVEMLDFTTLRLSFTGDEIAVALAKGMLTGLARCYGQEARFGEVPPSQLSPVALRTGRRYLDLTFVADSRQNVGYKRPVAIEKRRPSPAVAPKGLFR